jgi:lipoprotein-anchoring transpeptidase ErfK/SrfK
LSWRYSPSSFCNSRGLNAQRRVYFWPVGRAVSSGGVRLFNRDIVDLTNRVPVGANVTVGQG